MVQDIFKRLTSEHDDLRAWMESLSKHFETERFEKFASEMNAHMQAEELTLYQAIRDDKSIHSLVMEGYEAHHTSALLLRELQRTQEETDRWAAKFEILKELIEHHLDEEETQVFPRAKPLVGNRAEDLGETYERNHERVLAHA